MKAEKSFKRQIPFQTIPTNLAGVEATLAPPDDFDPNTAEAADLIKHGVLWRRPAPDADPALVAAWKRVFSRRWLSKDRIVPVMEPQPGKSHNLKYPVAKAEDGTYTSPIWGGCGLQGPPSSWNGVQGFWNVPKVSRPSEPQGNLGGWDSSSWVGLDGYNISNDVLQAGVQQTVNSAGQPAYVAWYEWIVSPPTNLPAGTPVDNNGYPLAWVGNGGKYQYIYQTNLPNFKVTAGQSVVASIVYLGNEKGYVSFANLTTGQHFQLSLLPPPGASFNGSTVEWIMEMPNFGWPNTSLVKFTPVVFTDAFATTIGCGSAGLPANGNILNIVSNGKQLTSGSVNGTTVTIDFVG
jgi:hypothetical protein